MSFDLEGRTAAYQTEDGAIAFFPNLEDAPDAYDVILGRNCHFYIPPRTLAQLTSPVTSAAEVMRILDNANSHMATPALERAGVSSAKFYIALLHLRIAEQEREIEYHVTRDI